jgi:hypothetical protein
MKGKERECSEWVVLANNLCEGEMAKDNISLIVIYVEQKDNDSCTYSMAMGSSVTNSTMTT